MTTTATYYTSYDDLQPYFADLSTLPRLSAQEEAAPLCRLRLAGQGLLSPEQAHAAKHRLIEGCLDRVVRLAREQQPLFHGFSLADLIQNGNLGLLQAVEDFDFTDPQGNFFAYATAWSSGGWRSRAGSRSWTGASRSAWTPPPARRRTAFIRCLPPARR